MKITVFAPKEEFTHQQLEKLKRVGEVVFVPQRQSYSLNKIKQLARDSHILAIDPDILGGFDFAKPKITELINCLPMLKGIALATTSTEYIDLNYCAKRNIEVLSVPGYATESVAEQTIGVIIGLAKRIFLLDRREQTRNFKMEIGFEVKGKTLGVVGLGKIGRRVVELARCLGMRVIAWNRTPKEIKGIKMVSLENLYTSSDIISLHLAVVPETTLFIGEKDLSRMKKGVMIVNLASRLLVDEEAMARVLKSGWVDSYVYEGDELRKGPLAEIERAFGFRIFSWYTKEALERATNIWVGNILKLAGR